MGLMNLSIFSNHNRGNLAFLSAVKPNSSTRQLRQQSRQTPIIASQSQPFSKRLSEPSIERFSRILLTPEYQSNITPVPSPQDPSSIQDIAQDLTRHYAGRYGHYLSIMRQELQSEGLLSGRTKSAFSIADKLRRAAREEDIKVITKRWAYNRISDGLGFRLTLKQGNPAEVDACVKRIAQLLKQGAFQILELADYHGPDIPSYLSVHHIRALQQANRHPQKTAIRNAPLRIIHNAPEAVKQSGYTAFHLKVRFPDGTPGELQIRGPQVEKIATVEHLVYDIRRQKTLPGRHSSRSSGANRNQLEAVIRSLDSGQTQDYLRYLAEYYFKARQLELGQSAIKTPILPDSLSRFAQLDLKRIRGSSLD